MPDIAVHTLPDVEPDASQRVMVVQASNVLGLTPAKGLDGADGNMWHVDAGDPPDSLGAVNDYYLDSAAGWIWVKRSSKWSNTYGNLKVNSYATALRSALEASATFDEYKTRMIELLEEDTAQ